MECKLRVESLVHDNRKRKIREKEKGCIKKNEQHPNQTCLHIYNAPEAALSLAPQVELS